jgi:hypothetical protein
MSDVRKKRTIKAAGMPGRLWKSAQGAHQRPTTSAVW